LPGILISELVKEKPGMNLYLIGYRGCGKSTVGSILGQRLDRRHIDSDEVLEQRTGKTVTEIFSQQGEAHFRHLETCLIKSFQAGDQCVISLGGGAILAEENRKWLKVTGKTAWLRASVEVLETRIQADFHSASRRPPLTGRSSASEVRTVLSQREPLYAQCADFKIDVEQFAPEEIATRIFQWWKKSVR
jgi:shikimate kinase